MDWKKIVELIKLFRISYFHLNGSEGGFWKTMILLNVFLTKFKKKTFNSSRVRGERLVRNPFKRDAILKSVPLN